MLRFAVIALLAVSVAACSSTSGYSGGKYQGMYVSGVDGQGNAVYQTRGKPPARAPEPTVCLDAHGCADGSKTQ